MSGLPMLNRRMALETVTREPDGAGGFVETPVVLGHLWARLEPRGGALDGAEGAPVSTLAVRITVRAAPPTSPQRPKPGQVLVEGPRRFRILAMSEADEEARYLTCFAREEEVSL